MRPIVKVLLVTDDWGGGASGNGGFLRWQDMAWYDAVQPTLSREFHLGEFTDTLRTTKWVGFDVELTCAHRTTVAEYQAISANNATHDAAVDEVALKANRGADVVGFRFNQPFMYKGQRRSLSDYDMALFFSIPPRNPAVNDAALLAEAEAIASFMEKGGGFFATGDHENLGGYLCGLIPRVRSMRRWWYGGSVPADMLKAAPGNGAERHDTTHSDYKGQLHFENQSDDIPQEISLNLSKVEELSTVRVRAYVPHPLLCTPLGQMDVLPDHMHEGECDVPKDLAARTYKISGNLRREYPDVEMPDGTKAPLAPEVIAYATVAGGLLTPAFDQTHHTGGEEPTRGERFGAIGVWDGHRAGQGRVIVDSTFHHFFDINISGDKYLEDEFFAHDHDLIFTKPLYQKEKQKLYGFFHFDKNNSRVPNEAYLKIQYYFRNIVYWLIPAGRHRQLQFSALKLFAARPTVSKGLSNIRTALQGEDSLSASKGRSLDEGHLRFLNVLTTFDVQGILSFGQLAEEYFRKTRGYCYTLDVPRLPETMPKIPWYEWIQDQLRHDGETEHAKTIIQLKNLAAIGIQTDVARLRSIAWGVHLIAAIVAVELEQAATLRGQREDYADIGFYDAAVHKLMVHVQGIFVAAIRNDLNAIYEFIGEKL